MKKLITLLCISLLFFGGIYPCYYDNGTLTVRIIDRGNDTACVVMQ